MTSKWNCLKWSICLLQICFLQCYCFANEVHYNNDDFYIKNYTDVDGLPQNSVQSIIKDELGFLWMNTQNGLVKFDGVKFRVYLKKDLGTNSDRIVSLTKSKYLNSIYAVNWNQQLIRIENGIPTLMGEGSDYFKKYDALFKLKTSKRVFYEIDWTPNMAVYRLDTHQYYTLSDFTFKYYENYRLIYSVDFPKNDRLELATYNIHLLKNRLYYIENDKVYSVYNKKISHVKIVLDGNEKTSSNQIYRIFSRFDDKRQNYISDNDHLYHIYYSDENIIKAKSVIRNFPFSTANITTIFYDEKYGRYYGGSLSKGLFMFSPKKFNVLKIKDLHSNVYYGQIEYKKDRILSGFGTVFNLEDNTFKYIDIGKYTDSWHYLMDGQGKIWTKLGNRITVLDSESLKPEKIIENNGTISCMTYVSKTNKVYIIDHKGPFLKSIHASNFQTDTLKKLLKINAAQFNLFTIDQDVYLTSDKGAFKYDSVKNELHIIPGTKNLYVRYVFKSHPKDSILWIAVEGKGVFAYNGKHLKMLPLDKNAFLLSPHTIIEDTLENFWISSNKGLFKVKKQLLYDFLEKGGNVFYQYYNKSNGFISNEFNGGGNPCVNQLSNGKISFSSMEGIVTFDPLEVIEYGFSEFITIDKVINGEDLLSIRDDIVWKDRSRNLSIELSTPYFGSAEDIVYFYKVNKNKNASISTNGVIQFNSLSVGTNRVEVYIPFQNEKGTFTKKIITIVVPPHWYETRFFYFLVLISVLLLLYLIYIYRVKNLEKENLRLDAAVKNRTKELVGLVNTLEESKNRLNKELYFQQSLNSNISHNVKTPLRYLMSSMGKFHQNMVKQGDPKNILESKSIFTASQELYHSTEQFVAYMKAANKLGNPQIERVHIYSLAEEVIKFYSNFLHQSQIKLINKVSDKFYVDAPKDFLKVIFSNFIDNAIKHAQATQVVVEGGVNKDDVLYIRFIDDGLGIDEKSIALFNNYYKDTQLFIHEDYIDIGIGLFTIKEMLPYVGAHVEFIPADKGAVIQMIFKTYSE